MHCEFYKSLTIAERCRYDRMLETSYVLTMCDAWGFHEHNEAHEESRSVSWIHSIRQALEVVGAPPGQYPQGSISANRHYYEAIRNYWGGGFPQSGDLYQLRQGLVNFLTRRRDDSQSSPSFLFGSYYEFGKRLGSRDAGEIKIVHTSLRHTAAALWILFEESTEQIPAALERSLEAFLQAAKKYLRGDEEWDRDQFKHMTLACCIKTCEALVGRAAQHRLSSLAERISRDCVDTLVSDRCLRQRITGDYEWIMPDKEVNGQAAYEYFINGFVLALVPDVVSEPRVQSVIRRMVSNGIRCVDGFGLTVRDLASFQEGTQPMPDFGASSVALFVLWDSLTRQLGGERWQHYCRENFDPLLKFCLNSYDKPSFYVLPYLESTSKVLLMPRCQKDEERDRAMDDYILALRGAIKREMEEGKGRLQKHLLAVQAPPGLEHTPTLIALWDIPKHWKAQSQWKTMPDCEKLSEYAGRFAGGFLQAYSS